MYYVSSLLFNFYLWVESFCAIITFLLLFITLYNLVLAFQPVDETLSVTN